MNGSLIPVAEAREKLILVFGRRSIRAYAPGEIPEATLQLLLEAAMAAPSAAGKDPWHFVIVRQPDRLRQLAAALPHGQMLAQASVGIIVCGDLSVAHDRQISYLLQDCSAAIENLLIAAHAAGLGACWLGIHPRPDRMTAVHKLLALPADVVPVCGISLGIPAEQREPRTRYNPACVHRETW